MLINSLFSEMDNQKVSLATINVDGVNNKYHELIYFVQNNNLDLIVITETKLKENERLKIRGYTTYRKDRDNQHRGGGVAILIKNSIPHVLLGSRSDSSIENLAIKLQDGTIVIGVYNNPRNILNTHDLNNLLNWGSNTLIIGDLNGRHPDWGCNRHNPNGNTVKLFVENNGLILAAPNRPTLFPYNRNNTPSTIDYIIYRNIHKVSKPLSVYAVSSDHNAIISKFNAKYDKSIPREITSYKNTNWNDFKVELDSKIKISNNDNMTEESIENEVKNFITLIQELATKYSEKIQINIYKDKFPPVIETTMKQKQTCRKRWQQFGRPEDRANYLELKRKVRKDIKSFRKKLWFQKIRTASTQNNSLWKLTKNLKKTFQNISSLDYKNKELISDKEKAEGLAQNWADIHKNTPNNDIQNQILNKVNAFKNKKIIWTRTLLSRFLTTPTEIKTIIKNMPLNKAPGLDNIENKVIKNLTNKAVVKLVTIYNSCIRNFYYPKCLKTALITPIVKAGKNPKDVNNYRPISLLSIFSKILDVLLHNRLKQELFEKDLIPNTQYGFRPGHSTESQVIRIVHNIKNNFRKHKNTVAEFLDTQKAFDTVWVPGLINNMLNSRIPNCLTKIILSFLTSRAFRVRVNSEISEEYEIHRGLPQGSSLSPTLYSIYTREYPESQHVDTALYADDVCLYASSFSSEVANRQLQYHLDKKIMPYFDSIKTNINPSKTEQVNFSVKKNDTKIFKKLKIKETLIEESDQTKYLGIILHKRLAWKHHLKYLTDKTNTAVKAMYPLINKNSKLSLRNKILIYKSIIRPVLTYGSNVFCSASNTLLHRLQVTQNKILRIKTNSNRYTSTDILHVRARMPKMKEYIINKAEKFYRKQIIHNPLTADIRHITRINTTNTKHGFVHQALSLYTG